jgi:hypothetical protein
LLGSGRSSLLWRRNPLTLRLLARASGRTLRLRSTTPTVAALLLSLLSLLLPAASLHLLRPTSRP